MKKSTSSLIEEFLTEFASVGPATVTDAMKSNPTLSTQTEPESPITFVKVASRKSKVVIACDMDGVLVDNNPRFIDIINATFQTRYTTEDIKSFAYDGFPDHIKSMLLGFWNMGWIYDDAKPEIGAMTCIEMMRSHGHRVIVASTPLEGHVRQKLEWLRLHNFPKEDVVLIHDKHLLQADILIDDGPHNMDAWLEMSRPLIAFVQPYNRDHVARLVENYPLSVRAARDWSEVRHHLYDYIEGEW